MRLAVGLTVGLVAWSSVANLWLGDRGYLARNLILTVGLLAVAHVARLGPEELGLASSRAGSGLRWGGAAAVLVALGIAAAVASAGRAPLIASLLADERAVMSVEAVRYHTLLRIPFGTALFEEVAFRGLLLAALLRVVPVTSAVIWSSLAFGVWHIAATAVTLRINGIEVATSAGMRGILAAVAITTVAGLAFAGLRLATGSLLAPILAHWATNAGGLVAAATTRP